MATHARQRLIDTAERLFYAEGVQAVGLERLLTESGVGRASFYRHFASKDDLVVAMLRKFEQSYWSWLEERVATHGGTVLSLFDALVEQAESSEEFRGCAFLNALAEVAEPGTVIRTMANEHKDAVADYLHRLLIADGYPENEALARQLLLIVDGAAVAELYERSSRPAHHARTMARVLLSQARADAAA